MFLLNAKTRELQSVTIVKEIPWRNTLKRSKALTIANVSNSKLWYRDSAAVVLLENMLSGETFGQSASEVRLPHIHMYWHLYAALFHDLD